MPESKYERVATKALLSDMIRKEVMHGHPLKQSIAIAYSKARAAGIKIPKKRKKVKWPKDW